MIRCLSRRQDICRLKQKMNMPHIHVALFKWKPDTLPDEIDRALAMVRSVTERVDGVSAIYCGENASRWSQGFTHAVVVVGKDQQAIDDYRADAVHAEAAKLIEAMELDGIGVDVADSMHRL